MGLQINLSHTSNPSFKQTRFSTSPLNMSSSTSSVFEKEYHITQIKPSKIDEKTKLSLEDTCPVCRKKEVSIVCELCLEILCNSKVCNKNHWILKHSICSLCDKNKARNDKLYCPLCKQAFCSSNCIQNHLKFNKCQNPILKLPAKPSPAASEYNRLSRHPKFCDLPHEVLLEHLIEIDKNSSKQREIETQVV